MGESPASVAAPAICPHAGRGCCAAPLKAPCRPPAAFLSCRTLPETRCNAFRQTRLAHLQFVGVIGPLTSFNGGEMRRVRYFFLALVWLALSLSFVSRAYASEAMDCDHDTVHMITHAEMVIDALLSP